MSAPLTDLNNVLQRLEKLEKQNRRLKFLGAALAVCMAAGLVMAAQPVKSKTAEFEQLVLRDANGKQRAAFGMGKHGPMLRFLNEEGKDTSAIGTGQNGLFFRLNNKDGNLQTGINLQKSGVVVVSYGVTGRLLTGTMAIQEMNGGFTK